MSMTRAQLTALVREIMNATGSNQWADSTLQTWLGVAQWKEWANILSTNNQYYMQTVASSGTTQDSNGQFDVSSLSTGSGDTAKYWFRILSVAQPSSPVGQIQFYYQEVRYEEFPNPQPNTSLPYVWYRFGSKIQILPVASGQQMSVTVNYRPPRVDQLSGDSVTVDFPDGYENLLAWEAAAMALRKGGQETDTALELEQMASVLRDQMLQDLGRQGRNPIVARAFDLASDWGA